MAKSALVSKKKRASTLTGTNIQVGERWHPSELAAIDAWIASSSDQTLTRAHAIRRLVALGLRVKKQSGQSSDTQKFRASEMAGQTIDNMADREASPADQADRKRRLLKGPEEFREARVDRPKKR
jgi:hypothetical protein